MPAATPAQTPKPSMDDELASIHALLPKVLPLEVHAHAAIVDPRHIPTLSPEEHAIIQNAAPRRQAEFATGRYCAKEALKHLGHSNASIPTHPNNPRQPIWPEGTLGSITHSHHLALAIAAPASKYQGLGIDLEKQGRLKEKLWRIVLTPTEKAYLQQQPEAQRQSLATIIFGTKEAIFKALAPALGPELSFQQATVTPSPDGTATIDLAPNLQSQLGPSGLCARYASSCEWVLAGVFCSSVVN